MNIWSNMVPPGKRRLGVVLILAAWIVKFSLGMLDAIVRHVPPPGPDEWVSPLGQIAYHVLIPAGFILFNIFLLLGGRKLNKELTGFFLIIQCVFIFFHTIYGGGGV
jgi:hypothetical protein